MEYKVLNKKKKRTKLHNKFSFQDRKLGKNILWNKIICLYIFCCS